MALPLSQLLNIRKGLTAFIGAGGKSAVIGRIAHELAGTVLICSSYYYYPYRDTAFLSISDHAPEREEELLRHLLQENHVVCAGEMVGNGKLGRPVNDFARLKTIADYVLLEADDARGLPLKAHAASEPVMPARTQEDGDTDDVVCVIGAAGFMRPVQECVHHPEVFCLLTGCAPDAAAKPELVAKAHINEHLATQFMINQVESKEALALSERFVNATDYKNIVVGSVRLGAYKRYL